MVSSSNMREPRKGLCFLVSPQNFLGILQETGHEGSALTQHPKGGVPVLPNSFWATIHGKEINDHKG